MDKNGKKPATPEEKSAQIRKEAKATIFLFVLCMIWHVGCGYLLNNVSIRFFGLPLWWLLSTPGVFVIAIIGLVYLLRNVFQDFDLGEEEEDDHE